MNIILKICGIFLITLLLQQPVCEGHFYVGATSGLVTLFQAVQVFMDSFMVEPKQSQSFILAATKSMYEHLDQGIEDIKNSVQHNQNVMELLLKKQKLEDNINSIQHALTECRSTITYITNNPNQKEAAKAEVIKLENAYDLEIKRSYREIQRTLTHTDVMTVLDNYFRADFQAFEHVCNTGISQLQLLEQLAISLTDITSQFYIARYIILDLVQNYGGRSGMQEIKELFDIEILTQYQRGIQELKTRMKNAARDVYACDKRLHGNDVRYQNGSGYYELIAFQNYIINQNNALSSIQTCKNAGLCGNIKKIVNCHKGSVPCDGVRPCKNALLNCKTMTYRGHRNSYACVSDDANSIARYSSVVSEDRRRDHFSCPKENERTLSSTVFHPQSGSTGQNNPVVPGGVSFCDVCNCICPDTIYYISTDIEWYSRPNTVLTGVRFRMKDNTLYIQAQNGVLLPGAKVDPDTLEWSNEPKKFDSRVQISWNGVRGFDLTKIQLPKDYVIVGLRFEDYTNERVRLRSVAQKFNFTTGKIIPNTLRNNFPPEGSEEVNLSNLNVPTRSPAITKVKTDDKQFVKFTTTSEEKDGGQTTIPFIENLNVVSKIPVAMGGVGLVYKASNEGYGGFLGLKLLTYNIEPHVEIPTEMPKVDIDSYISKITQSS